MATFLVTTRIVVNTTLEVQAESAEEAEQAFYDMTSEAILTHLVIPANRFTYDFDAEVTGCYPKETT